MHHPGSHACPLGHQPGTDRRPAPFGDQFRRCSQQPLPHFTSTIRRCRRHHTARKPGISRNGVVQDLARYGPLARGGRAKVVSNHDWFELAMAGRRQEAAMAHMTIGVLSQRTGVPAKALREYADAGLIYTAGRSAANYRLFDEDALWCVGVINSLRGVGLTVAEIRHLVGLYLRGWDEPVGPALATLLHDARNRTTARITELQRLLERIDRFQADHAAELAGQRGFRARDPRAHRTDA